MIQISNIKLGIDQNIDLLEDEIRKVLRPKTESKLSYRIIKESIDARKRGKIDFVYQVEVWGVKESDLRGLKHKDVKVLDSQKVELPNCGEEKLEKRPIVIGMGPAGMFAALTLAKRGFKPIVIEKGKSVEDRNLDVERFWEKGILDSNSNVQFGEGGAGTFSDGKLTTRIKDKRVSWVLEEMVKADAPEDILYSHRPHVGTDILRKVVENIRKEIIKEGGEVIFSTSLEDIEIKDGKVKAAILSDGKKVETDIIILALGHSSRQTYRMLEKNKVAMQQKPFAVGLRIEHPQILINKAQYKEFWNHPRLGAADYKLTYQASTGRSAYTFCMCPGGQVIGSSSETGQVVVNGMSYHSRNGENANSALLVNVNPEDFKTNDILGGISFQEKFEKIAFEIAGGNYNAPVQRVGDFLNKKKSINLGNVKPSYRPGITLVDFDEVYPEFITETMRESIVTLDNRLKGFALEDAVLTGVETRSSAPVRIQRDDKGQSLNTKGLYPAGEGAGYAGGIVSAAVDGMKVAESIVRRYMSNF